MQKRHVSIVDPNTGQARPGAHVFVRNSDTLSAANLFADNEVSPLPNPLTADSTGTVTFKAPDGEYDFVVSGPGFLPRTITRVQIADKDSFAQAGGIAVAHAHDSTTQGGLLDPATCFNPAGGTVPIQHIMSAEGTARFDYVSPTQCQLGFGVIPLKVGSVWRMRAINTPVYLSNTGLPSSTYMYVYAYDNAGVTTLEASVGGYGPTEFGVHVKVGDPSRTLVGHLATSGTSQFEASPQRRHVGSWFRRQRRDFQATNSMGTNSSTGSLAFVDVHGNLHTHFVAWGGEAVTATASMFVSNSVSNGATYICIGLGANLGFPTAITFPATTTGLPPDTVHRPLVNISFELSDGAWFLTVMGAVNAGVGTFFDTNQAISGTFGG